MLSLNLPENQAQHLLLNSGHEVVCLGCRGEGTTVKAVLVHERGLVFEAGMPPLGIVIVKIVGDGASALSRSANTGRSRTSRPSVLKRDHRRPIPIDVFQPARYRCTRRCGAAALRAQPLVAEQLQFQQFDLQLATLSAWANDLPALRLVTEWNNVAASVQTEQLPELLLLAESWPKAGRKLAGSRPFLGRRRAPNLVRIPATTSL